MSYNTHAMHSDRPATTRSVLDPIAAPPGSFVLDIGGEGRHPGAWNLNPRTHRTVRGAIGLPIPRLIVGRGESIPLADHCVDLLIVERTPLPRATLLELVRVAKSTATAILRHAIGPLGDPHRRAVEVFPAAITRRTIRIGPLEVRETVFRFERQ